MIYCSLNSHQKKIHVYITCTSKKQENEMQYITSLNQNESQISVKTKKFYQAAEADIRKAQTNLHALKFSIQGKEECTFLTDVTLVNRLWLGEQTSSQKRFKKFLKQAGQPTRRGITCNRYLYKNIKVLREQIVEHKNIEVLNKRNLRKTTSCRIPS